MEVAPLSSMYPFAWCPGLAVFVLGMYILAFVVRGIGSRKARKQERERVRALNKLIAHSNQTADTVAKFRGHMNLYNMESTKQMLAERDAREEELKKDLEEKGGYTSL